MHINTSIAAITATATVLVGCAGSPTERAFGDAVRSVVSAQRAQPEPREPVLATDAARMESVLTIYRTWVGEPLTVVPQRPVEESQ